MTPEPLLKVSDLSLQINGVPILQDVSFSVLPGETVVIIGPNGAGKTSLLRCLARLNTHASGSIDLLGRPVSQYTRKELAKIISFVPQSSSRHLPFTVMEFVLMARYAHFRHFYGVEKSDEQAVQNALAMTGTARFSDRKLRTLSGGERQKVMIAAAIAQGARIMLMDEPASFLDYKHEVALRMLIRRIKEENDVTIVLVTHDLNKGVFQADQVIALKQGRVVFKGTPEQLIAPEVLPMIYDIPFECIIHPGSGRPVLLPERYFNE